MSTNIKQVRGQMEGAVELLNVALEKNGTHRQYAGMIKMAIRTLGVGLAELNDKEIAKVVGKYIKHCTSDIYRLQFLDKEFDEFLPEVKLVRILKMDLQIFAENLLVTLFGELPATFEKNVKAGFDAAVTESELATEKTAESILKKPCPLRGHCNQRRP